MYAGAPLCQSFLGELRDAWVTLTARRPGYDRLCLWLCYICLFSAQFADSELFGMYMHYKRLKVEDL